MKRICVYCGSNPGGNPEFKRVAIELGKALVDNQIELVYGGASVGLMGTIADTVLEHGGKVIGIIPDHLKYEVAHDNLTELHVVGSMHERKKMMIDLSDAMIAMPGGFGTLDEIFEAVTWGQLRLHNKPCGLLNICGYYDKLLDFLGHAVQEKLLCAEHRAMLLDAATPEALLEQLSNYTPPTIEKWWKKE